MLKASPFLRGIVLILLAVFLFDVMGAIVKHLSAHYPPQQLSVLRNLFGLIPSLVILVGDRSWHRSGRPIRIRQWKLGLMRGAMVAIAQLCFYTALHHMAFATASTLAFAAPLFITALSVPVLAERVGAWRWTAVVIGFIGIVLIMRPGSEVFSIYALLPIGAAFFYAASSVAVRRMDQDVSTAHVNLYAAVGAFIGALILLLTTTTPVPVTSAIDWLWIIGMGIAGGCAILCMIGAYRITRPADLAPFEYFGIPFSFILGWLAFNEAPVEQLFPGALLIIAGGLLIVWRERRSKQTRNL